MAQARRVVMITGANGAIGEAIARLVAARPRFEVVLACRNESRARRAAANVRAVSDDEHVRYEVVDVASAPSIDALKRRWSGPLHVLVNNAAATPRRRETTAEGLEVQLATNVLGYLRMIRAFEDVLRASAPSRVVNVASYWAGGLEVDDLGFDRRPYDNDAAYRQSKQADRMLTVALAERLGSSGVTVNACHPGDVRSELSENLGFGGHETPEEAADTPAWLATSPELQAETGRYFERRQPRKCRFGADREAVERLYAACVELA